MAVTADFLADHRALLEGAGILEMSGRTQIEVSGRDRASFLHNLCTQEMRQLQPGTGCEAFFTQVQGRILAYVNAYCRTDSILLETVPGQATALLAHLDRYLIREDVQLVDRTAERTGLLVAGALAAGVLSQLLPAATPLPQQPLAHVSLALAGGEVSLRRVPLAGEECYLLDVPRDRSAALRETLVASGARPVGPEALEAARVEAGVPYYGRDISDRNLPQEVGRNERAISFQKGCYLGQETVARIDALGHVNRLLRGVAFEGSDVPEAGSPLQVDDRPAGQVTSAVYSPRLKSALALAYVRRESAATGSRFRSPYGPAAVIDLPLR